MLAGAVAAGRRTLQAAAVGSSAAHEAAGRVPRLQLLALPAVEAELVEVEARCRRARAEAAVAWARAEEWRDAPALLEGSDAWLAANGYEDYGEWQRERSYEAESAYRHPAP